MAEVQQTHKRSNATERAGFVAVDGCSTEEALVESEQRLRAIFENAQDAILLVNDAGRYQDANPAAEKLTGYARSELLSMSIEDLTSPDLRPGVEPSLNDLQRTGRQSGEYMLRRKNGSLVTVEYRAVANVLPGLHLSILNDVSERAEAELERRKGEERFRELADAMPAIVWSAFANGAIDYLNRRYFDYTGLSTDVPGEEGWNLVVHPEDRPAGEEHYKTCLREGTVWEHELRLRRHDGEYRWHLSRCVPVLDDQGKPRRWYANSTDIHDQKLAEARILDMNVELEQRVVERTAQYEAANKEMEGFTYSVSHDLRGPLRAIMSTSMILREDYSEALPEDAQQHLDRQAKAASKMGSLIDDLLKLSRIARQEMNRADVDLSEMATEVYEEIAGRELCENVQFAVEDGLSAKVDSKLFRLVVLNLIDNACKFSPGGGKITLGREIRNGETIFFVRDEGIGFDQQYAEKMFLPFERLVLESEFPGTGIGLANVKRIVERHGGKIWSEGELGKGSTFYFTVPA
jgi:PAS domain S-box-containing protein